jgi:asparagine synthase (glutamine-hydrolysing)
MSALAALLGGPRPGSPEKRDQVSRMLESCRRGWDDSEVRVFSDGALGVARIAWESAAHFSGPVGCFESDGVVVAADATLYYDADLRKSLRAAGVEPAPADGRMASSTHRILEAYRAWGSDAASHLEGDFAFILWDKTCQRLIAARSFSGKRPLYFWEENNSLALASTVAGLTATAEVRAPLDFARVGLQASGLTVNESETPFKGVRAVAPGETLIWSAGSAARLVRHWKPRADPDASRFSFEEAALSLRKLLTDAVAERLAPRGASSVWMSDGRDSTAVFAAGQAHLSGNMWRRLRPVSWSAPAGDPGHEDAWVSATAERWGECPIWLDPYSVSVLDSSDSIERDEPFVHLFERWNNGLARASWEHGGSRVALDGNGGDQLFGATPHALSDLLVTGRWTELYRQWQSLAGASAGAGGGGGPGGGGARSNAREFLETVVRPAVPRWVFAPVDWVRGKPMGYLAQRQVPSWISASFAAGQDLQAHQRDREWSELYCGPGRVGRSEMEFFFRSGEMARHHSLVSSVALRGGVELRSPLSDGRLISFAFSRPLTERLDGLDSRRLLRAAMKGLVPDAVLASRQFRTGTTRFWFVRSLLQQAPAVLRSFGGRMALADAGIVDAPVFQREWEELLRRGEHPAAVQLYRTLQAELWLRERLAYGQMPREANTRSGSAPLSGSAIISNSSSRTEVVRSDGARWFPARSLGKGA